MAGPWEDYGSPTADGPWSEYGSKAPAAPQKAGVIRRIADMTAVPLAQGIVGVPELAVGVADLATGGRAGKAAEDLGFRPREARQIIGDALYSDEQKAANEEVARAEGFLPTLGAMVRNPSTIVRTAVESVPSMLAGGAVSRIARAALPAINPVTAGAIGEGVVAAGQNAEQVRQESPTGTLTPTQSAYLGASGAITGAISRLSGGLASRLGVGDPETALARGALGPTAEGAEKAAQKGFLRKAGEGFFTEGVLEELPQSMQEQVAQNLAQGKPWNEGVGAAGAAGLLAGGITGAAVGPLGSGQAPAQTPPRPLLLGYDANADALIGFPDGTVARRSEMENYLASLPEDQRLAAQAKLFGYGPQAAEALTTSPGAAPVGTATGAPAAPQAPDLTTSLGAAPVRGGIPFERDIATPGLQLADPAAEAAARARTIDFQNPDITPAWETTAGAAPARTGLDLPPREFDTSGLQLGPISRAAAVTPPAQPETKTQGSETKGAKSGTAGGQAVTPAAALDPAAGPISRAAALAQGLQRQPEEVPPRRAAAPAEQVAPGATGTSASPAAVQNVPRENADFTPGPGDIVVDDHFQAAHAAATSPLNDRTEPTEGQKGAGNYAKGHVKVGGLDISIENPQGSKRRGRDAGGKEWETELTAHYGYIRRTEGADGDHVDVFIKPGTPADFNGMVYVVDQIDPKTRRYDEHKVILGAASGPDAARIYRSNYAAGWKGLGDMTAMPMAQFKEWVKSDATKQPLSKKIQPAPAAASAAAGPESSPAPAADARAARAGVPADAAPPAAVARETKPAQSETKSQKGETKGLRLGITPGDAEPVTVRDGVVYIGNYAAANFETGEEVRVPPGANPVQIRKALQDAGAVGKRQKFFGGEKQDSAPVESGMPPTEETGQAAIETPLQRRDADKNLAAVEQPTPAVEAPKPLDHGELNIPGRTDTIDAELDRFKAQQRKLSAAKNREEVAQRKAAKTRAKELFNELWPAMKEKMASRFGEKELRSTLDSMVKWEPAKFIALAEKFQKEQASGGEEQAKIDLDAPMPSGLTMAQVRERIAEMRGMSIPQAQAVVHNLTNDWKGGIEVRVVATPQDLPTRNPNPGTKGYYANGIGYVVASKHKTAQDIGRTIAHEVIQHHGMRNVLGEDSWRRLMAQIQAATNAGNPELQEARDYVRKAYRRADGSYMLQEGGSLESDEVAARLIERSVDENGQMRPKLQWLKWVWAKVAGFLREAGLKIPLTMAELHGIWVESRRAIEAGAQAHPDLQAALSARASQAAVARMPFQHRPTEQKAAILQGPPVADLPTKQAPRGFIGLRRWALKLFEDAGGKATNPELGEVVLNHHAVRDSLGHGINQFKAEAFAAVPAVIEKGVVVHSGRKGDQDNFWISAPVRIQGKDDVVTVLVRRDANTQRMYLHSVATKEYLLNPRVSRAPAGAGELTGSSNSGDVASVLRELLEFKLDGTASEGSDAGGLAAIDIAGDTGRYTPEQLAAMRRVGFATEPVPLADRMRALWKDAGKRLAQGLVDQFAPIKDISREAYGLLRLSKGASGAFEVLLHGGQLKLESGVYDFDETKKGGVIERLLKPLQGEHHDFFRWVAANRAEQLAKEDRERLFTPEDIAALKTLADGELTFDFPLQHGPKKGQTTRSRAEAYADSLATFNEFNKNTLDMAQKSGLIDGESRRLWEREFYVPFYRVEDEGGVRGMNIRSGVVRQQAFKQLKGGSQQLNADLLENTLMNWAHLIDAAAKNRAAKATLEAMGGMGAAVEASEDDARDMGKALGKRNNVVWFSDGGRKRYFLVDDPYLLAAVSALEYSGFNSPVMKALGTTKHWLTVGVTASPFFKVRNLIRDSVQAIGSAPLGANPVGNVAQGWAATKPGSEQWFRLLAGGGTIHFGTMMEGSEARRVQSLVEAGVDRATILDNSERVKAFYRKTVEPLITAYNELGNRGEAVNRAALYEQLRKQGVSHAEASLQARDLMDFSMQGSFTTVRFLTQVVPFFNARVQGLYKLGRAAAEDPARFSAVLGATALLSIGLLAAYSDDDDWKKREDWDRNNYWWFKAGGVAYRIPKPFEIGAIATLAERSWELSFEREMTNQRFREQVVSLLGDQLAMNPIPQMVKPIIDLYANKDSFTGRPIETMGMEKLQPQLRFREDTSMFARGASTALSAAGRAVGMEGPSPVQVDHLLRGYFGWLGALAVAGGDIVARPATDQVSQPTPDWMKVLTGAMASRLDDAPSRYVSAVYDQAKKLEQAYGTWRHLLREGKVQEAQAFREEYEQDLVRYRQAEAVKRVMTNINQMKRRVEGSDASPDEKREQLRALNARADAAARRLAPL